jgi:hypothetical protein
MLSVMCPLFLHDGRRAERPVSRGFGSPTTATTPTSWHCIKTSLNCTRFIDHPFIMPWQSVSSLLVVGGAFNVAAGLVGAIHYLSTGVSIKLLSCSCHTFDSFESKESSRCYVWSKASLFLTLLFSFTAIKRTWYVWERIQLSHGQAGSPFECVCKRDTEVYEVTREKNPRIWLDRLLERAKRI